MTPFRGCFSAAIVRPASDSVLRRELLPERVQLFEAIDLGGSTLPHLPIAGGLGVAGLSDLPNFRIFSSLKEALEVVDQG